MTSVQPKRLIYFRGHKKERDSAMITQICMNYETFSGLREGECATRTLLNLYNLQAVRGRLTKENLLALETSMSGPHHYFGYLNPFGIYTIEIDEETNLPNYLFHSVDTLTERFKIKLESEYPLSLVCLADYEWMSGVSISEENIKKYKLTHCEEDETVLEESPISGLTLLKKKRNRGFQFQESGSAIQSTDSLFAYPGILALSSTHNPLRIPLLINAVNFDLSDFRAQVVHNSVPFQFTKAAISAYEHAQHRLRVITYFYGPRYVPDYLMDGNGLFIEKHEFIQSITPLSKSCGGYVVLGREVTEVDEKNSSRTTLDLIAITIPFGQTLLVEPYCIHGDSTLIGKMPRLLLD